MSMLRVWHITAFSISLLVTVAESLSIYDCNIEALKCAESSNSTCPRLDYFTSLTSNTSLTLPGCQVLCESKLKVMTKDCGVRLFQWLLPGVFLIISMAMPAASVFIRAGAAIHAFVDPIDAKLSVAFRLNTLERCYLAADNVLEGQALDKREAVFALANVLDAILYLEPGWSLQELVDKAKAMEKKPATDDYNLLKQTSRQISANRSREILRPVCTVVLGIASIVVATAQAAAGNPPSGAMLAAALTFSYLFPGVLISNDIGEHGSPHILRGFPLLKEIMELKSGTESNNDTDLSNNAEDIVLRSGTTTYQPRKQESGAWTVGGSPPAFKKWATLVTLSINYVVCVVTGSLAVAAPPVNFSHRHIVILALAVAWISSYLYTFAATYFLVTLPNEKNHKALWRLVALKDAMLIVSVPVFFSATTCGWLSSCRMWSGCILCRDEDVTVETEQKGNFDWNNNVLYPILVGVGLGFNVVVYIIVRLVQRQAFSVVSWKPGVVSRYGLRSLRSYPSSRA